MTGTMARARRVRYDRKSLESAISAARRASASWLRTVVVFGTAYGYTVSGGLPPVGQDYYAVAEDGSVRLVKDLYNAIAQGEGPAIAGQE